MDVTMVPGELVDICVPPLGPTHAPLLGHQADSDGSNQERDCSPWGLRTLPPPLGLLEGPSEGKREGGGMWDLA